MTTEAQKKAMIMRRKTDQFRRLFNIPEPETVIQDYACTLRRTPGRMYISQNYICFGASLTSYLEIIPMRKVKEVLPEKTLILSNGIRLTLTDNTKLSFGGLVHRDEALNLINYLWNNPPSVVELPQERISNSSRADELATGSDGTFLEQKQMVQVDVEASKRALRLAMEARNQGADVLSELEIQAETIDRIEASVENIHHHLDTSDKLLRGIESLPAYIGNLMKSKKKPMPVQDPKDRKIIVEKQERHMDIEILYKWKNDSLSPALLRLSNNDFSILNPETDLLIVRDAKWKYEEVQGICLRARHEHMDIRFSHRERLRFMSSYVQIITNELVLRTQEGQVAVEFEPGVKQFPFGDPRISVLPMKSTRSANTFMRKEAQIKTSNLLSDNVSQKIRNDMDETDKDMDQIQDFLLDLGDMAVAMGTEIDRSGQQLDKISVRVDQAQHRMDRSNRRIDNLLDD
eukprot:TRINITY_DN13061_c0_g1_i1.p1 TRINITY_DN13061_c0_g1~~TRINITY_DN13061_c0_g1_i1.p1  ORF type:complete len:461 (-),score=88.31 TRINITY_DN13061_c0_g1_i1:33-1415(-)